MKLLRITLAFGPWLTLRTRLCALPWLVALSACAGVPPVAKAPEMVPAAPRASPRMTPGEPYIGVSVSNAVAGGVRADTVLAGPAAVAGLAAGDRITHIRGEPADAARFVAIVGDAAPGTTLQLSVQRDAQSGAESVALELVVVVDDRERWRGPAARARTRGTRSVPARATWFDDILVLPELQSTGLERYGERLERMFAELGGAVSGSNKLALAEAALRTPAGLVQLEEFLTRDIRASGADVSRAHAIFCRTLDAECAADVDRYDAPSAASMSDRLAATVTTVEGLVADAFAPLAERRELLADARYLLEETGAGRLIYAQSEATRAIHAMLLGEQLDFELLLRAFARLLAVINLQVPTAQTTTAVPSAARGAVEGAVEDIRALAGGYVVLGGDGANRYDMSRVLAVMDRGGNDTYDWPDAEPPSVQLIVDIAGDDHYQARYGGPGAGWLGVSVLVDRTGDDHYRSTYGGCGAGVFGFGLLVDGGGNDEYRCDTWSFGSALYGGGAIIEQGAGGDAYLSQTLSQAVGGPRGIGFLLDLGGDDLYRANGLVRSVYGTAAVYAGISQGVGYGLRPHDTGGIGVLVDTSGSDRYEGGEFSQGGGYFWGVGILRDEAGDDLYYGNRYAQGFAAHQAAGILVDMRGDDIYWSMTAGGQAAAWDQSLAMLYDGAGSDLYRGASLSQGAAAHQSSAWLIDISGDDEYWSSTKLAQGMSASNTYHFDDADPIYSFSILIDRHGHDRYSSGLGDRETRITEGFDAAGEGTGYVSVAIDAD